MREPTSPELDRPPLPRQPGSNVERGRYDKWILTAMFLSTRALYVSLGGAFNAEPLDYFWQVADPELLREELWYTLVHLHSQAPMFNLMIGVSDTIAGASSVLLLQCLYCLMSLGVGLALLELLRRLSVRRWIRWAVIMTWVSNPGVLLYEFWLFYELPTAFLVAWSLLFFLRFAQGQDRCLFGFFAVNATLCLLQSQFHLLWFLLAAVFVIRVDRVSRKYVLMSASVPFAIVLIVYLKQVVVFGAFTLAPAHLGPNLREHTAHTLPRQQLLRLVDDGIVSSTVLPRMFANVSEVEQFVPWEPTGVAILDRPKRKNGVTNYQHLIYLNEARQVMSDVKILLQQRPDLYFASIVSSFRRDYFKPWEVTSPTPEIPDSEPALFSSYRRFYSRYVYLQDDLRSDSAALFMLIPLSFACVLKLLWEYRRDPVVGAFLMLATFYVLFVSATNLLVATSDHNRYRYRIAIVLWIALALGAEHFRRTTRIDIPGKLK